MKQTLTVNIPSPDMENTAIQKYCEREGFRLAQRIDAKMSLVIKPKPKYCPTWLYKKIIKDSVELVSVSN